MPEKWTKQKVELEKIKSDLNEASVCSNGAYVIQEDEILDPMAGQILWAKEQSEEARLKGGYT
jgi:hypothetical protein